MAATQNPGRSRTNGAPGTNGTSVSTHALVRPGITSAPLPTVALDSRTFYDFVNSASPRCGEPEDMLPEDWAWLAKARGQLADQLGKDSVAWVSIEFVMELARVAVEKSAIQTSADLVAAIDAMTDEEIQHVLVDELLNAPEYGDLAKAALDGDEAAWEQLEAKLIDQKGYEIVAGTLPELTAAARQAVHAWQPIFQEVEGRIGQMLARDVAARSTDEAERDPLGFVERATNGIRVTPERSLRQIRLAASYFMRPYNAVLRVGDTIVICYPIADSAVGPASRSVPPTATVRLYRALGDETRLRILRLLADRDRYLTELANELGLSKPTISHHLALLRTAGLVTVNEEGNLTYYTLRRDRVLDAGPELSSFLTQ